jgi:hypothetical protein
MQREQAAIAADAQVEAEIASGAMRTRVEQTLAGMARSSSLLNMTDEAIKVMAEEAGDKVLPLLSVQKEFIDAALDAIIEKFDAGSFSATMRAYLTSTEGIGLTSAQVDTLGSLYLE